MDARDCGQNRILVESKELFEWVQFIPSLPLHHWQLHSVYFPLHPCHLLYLCCTLRCTGKGEPTDNAKGFFDWVMDQEREPGILKDLRYGVIADLHQYQCKTTCQWLGHARTMGT